MAITLTQLQSELQERLGSTVNIKASAEAQKNAFNRVLDRLQLKGNWLFTNRKKVFDYLPDMLEYSVTNYLSLEDFKDVYRISGEYLEKSDPRRFPKGENLGVHTRDAEKFISILLDGGGSKLIDGLGSVTEDGLWSAVGDAVNLAADANEYKGGSGSLKFNIDVSNSASDYAGIKNTTKTAVDLTDYEDRSSALLWVYLPDVTNVSSIQIMWGSDDSNYWSGAVTAPIDSSAFQVGWNRVVLKWTDATETGSPDVTAVDYNELRINYSAAETDRVAARFSDLRFNIRQQYDLEYFSTYMVRTSAGVYQSRLSGGTDVFLGDDDMKPLLIECAYYEIIRNTKTLNRNEISIAKQESEDMLNDAFVSYGFTRNKGKRRINTKL